MVPAIWIVLVWASQSVRASFNLYLSTQEMKRLLGLENELYYVTDGTVNKYAMGFVIPVPSSVSSLHFTWSSPLSPPPTYSLSTLSSHPAALPTPPVNISSQGTVPGQPQVWKLSLECTGTEAAEVVVTLDISLTGLDPSLPLNRTELKFRRKKTCFLTRQAPDDDVLLGGPVEEVQGVPAYVVFFAGVGSCLVLLVLVLSLVIATWLRSTAAPKGLQDTLANCTQYTPVPDTTQNNSGVLGNSLGSHNVSKEPEQERQGGGGYSTSTLLPAPHRTLADGLTTDGEWGEEQAGVPVEALVVDRLALTLGDLLLEGTFGRVYQGRLVREGGSVDVMVKTIVTGSARAQAEKLVTEGSTLHPATHRHVLAILATTTDGSSPIMIYDYLSPGNLKRWLLSCHQPVSTHQAVSLGLQLLSALRHVHRKQIVHRDVAARNCYLSSSPNSPNLSLKLCDAALSKDLFPGDYHCLGDNENRPVKWMAVDTISSGQFSVSSDIWAWGVTMWEILTRAQQPFPDVDPFEMESYLMEGFRLHQPVNCPDQLYTVMVSCWAHRSIHRAGLPALYSHLKQFSQQLQQFV